MFNNTTCLIIFHNYEAKLPHRRAHCDRRLIHSRGRWALPTPHCCSYRPAWAPRWVVCAQSNSQTERAVGEFLSHVESSNDHSSLQNGRTERAVVESHCERAGEKEEKNQEVQIDVDGDVSMSTAPSVSPPNPSSLPPSPDVNVSVAPTLSPDEATPFSITETTENDAVLRSYRPAWAPRWAARPIEQSQTTSVAKNTKTTNNNKKHKSA